MKRTNVILDEELLEKARRASGEKTYSSAITKALEEYVQRHDFWEAYKEFEKEVQKGDFFWPGYLEELRPNAHPVLAATNKRVSAHEKRAPRKSTRRGHTR
jgi:hypothetical protein